MKNYIVLHTSDVSEKLQYNQFNNINSYHRDVRLFPKSKLGYYVGYQYLITGGEVYQCREDDEVGAHCNQLFDGVNVYPPREDSILSMNVQSIGICLGFDGDIEMPSDKHYKLLQELVWKLQDKYDIPNHNVFFHRKFSKSKTCPGLLITDEWLKVLLTRKPEAIDMSAYSIRPTELCTDDCIQKQSWWYNLIKYIISLIK